jgi:DNA-binding response OmpR family regulator
MMGGPLTHPERELIERDLAAHMEGLIATACAERGITREDFLSFARSWLSRGAPRSFDAATIGELIGLGAFERRVFERLNLRFGAWVSNDALVEAVYGGEYDGGPERARAAVAVKVAVLRRKLRPYCLTVGWRSGPGGDRRLEWVQAK